MSPKRFRTNPTGIKPIDRSQVSISVHRNSRSEVVGFTLDRLDLSAVALTDEAPVLFIAYSGFDEIRINAGTVSNITLPKNVSLGRLDATGLMFRVFVTEVSGYRIIASCEAIRAEDEKGDRTPLLAVEYQLLDERMWDLKLENGARPVLRVNNNPNLDLRRYFETRDPLVRGLIVPQAFEQALVYLVLNPAADDDPSRWQNVWTAYLERRVDSIPERPEDMNALESVYLWARNVASAFAEEIRFVSKAIEQQNGGTHGQQN